MKLARTLLSALLQGEEVVAVASCRRVHEVLTTSVQLIEVVALKAGTAATDLQRQVAWIARCINISQTISQSDR